VIDDIAWTRSIIIDLVQAMLLIIINNIVAVPFDSLFKFAANTNTRGHPLKLYLNPV